MKNFLFIILLGAALLAAAGVVSETKENIVYRQPDGLELWCGIWRGERRSASLPHGTKPRFRNP